MTTQERKEKTEELKKQHLDYFESVNLNNYYFTPKVAYRPRGKDELFISFFKSELEKQTDVYTEFINPDNYAPTDIKRTLYKFKKNRFWEEEYEETQSRNGYVRYLVPVSELLVVSDITMQHSSKIDSVQEIQDPEDNFSYKGLVIVLNEISKTLKQIKDKI